MRPAIPLNLRPGTFGRAGDLLVVLVITTFLPAGATAIAGRLVPALAGLDPDGTFMRISVHHLLQLALTVALMKAYSAAPMGQWGFTLDRWQLSLRFTLGFVLFSTVITVLFGWATYHAGALPPLSYPLSARNVTGTLAFQFFLSGPCEEPLFRGFAMALLAVSWPGTFGLGKTRIPVAGLWATLLFMFGHIGIDIQTLTVTHFSLGQQIVAIPLGLFYAVAFHRTGSLLAPVLAHSYFNLLSLSAQYLIRVASG